MPASRDFAIRLATASDAAAVAGIYAPYVRETAISFELAPPTAPEMRQRIEDTLKLNPWLAAERDGRVVGYAHANKHKERPAYRFSVDTTVYVAAGAHGSGCGRRLYLGILTAQGYRTAFAGIALPNAASVGLHEAMGFEPLGVYRNVGFKFDRWRDVGWWQLALAVTSGVPAEPVPFSEFQQDDAAKLTSLLAL